MFFFSILPDNVLKFYFECVLAPKTLLCRGICFRNGYAGNAASKYVVTNTRFNSLKTSAADLKFQDNVQKALSSRSAI